jgi:hypothetical protein
MTDTPSIVDVLENILGELTLSHINALTAADMDGLAQAVNVFYEGWRPPPSASDELRLYSGGWIAGNLAADDSRQQLYSSLLYGPAVVMHDPIAEWFDPYRSRIASPPPLRGALGGVQVQGAEPQLMQGDGYHVFSEEPERTRSHLAAAVPLLAELAPLIRRGIVVPIPQWQLVRQHQDGILAAVRHDVQDVGLATLIEAASSEPPPRSDHIRGLDVQPPGGFAAQDRLRAVVQNPAYFLNKTFAIAEATSSRYVPPAPIDAALSAYRIDKLAGELRRKSVDLQVVAALAAADLPFLGELDVKAILAVHDNEPAFAEWRAELRTVARAIETTPSQGAEFVREAGEVISDALLPRARAVQQAVSRSETMKRAAADQAVTFGVGAASITGAAIISGTALAPAALIGLGLSAIGRAVFASVFGPESTTHGVLTSLVRRR